LAKLTDGPVWFLLVLASNRGAVGGDQPEAVQGDGAGVRGAAQGGEARAGHGEEGRDLAVRALQPRRPPLRRAGLRQEGAAGVRAPGRRRHARLQLRRPHGGRAAGGAARHHVQRRQPQRLLHHVIIRSAFLLGTVDVKSNARCDDVRVRGVVTHYNCLCKLIYRRSLRRKIPRFDRLFPACAAES